MVRILHTGDLHGYLGTLPRLVTLIERERSGEPNNLLLDAGDMYSPGRSAGLQLELLSALGYDAVVPGNAEKDQPTTAAMIARLGCPVVAANLAPLPEVPSMVPYVMRETGGLRVGVLGLTVPTPYPGGHRLHVSGRRDVPVQDPLEAARAFVPRLRKEVDLLIVLSHLGTSWDVRMAREIPGIDLVVGGHSHHRVFAPIVVGNTAVVQAGPQGTYLGVLDVEEESAGSRRFRITGRIEPVWQEIRASAWTAERMDRHYAEVEPGSVAIIGETPGCWADPWSENPWTNAVLDGIRRDTGADLAAVKAMMVFPVQDAGPFRALDIDRSVPALEWLEAQGFDRLVALRVPASDLRPIFEHAVSDLTMDAVGPQARCDAADPANNLLQVSGACLEYDLSAPAGRRVSKLHISGAPARQGGTYALGTTEFLARGYSGYRWLREAERIGSFCTIRESIARTVAALAVRPGPYEWPPVEGRLVI